MARLSAERIGRSMARVVFKKRGNHSEAHLTETELATCIIAAIMFDRKETYDLEPVPLGRALYHD